MTAYQAFAVGRIVLALLLSAFFLALAAGRLPLGRVKPLAFGLLAAALLSYPNFGLFHPYQDYRVIHYLDAFHYFMGAKYLPELGYARLYEATYVAGREMGQFADVTRIRDLATYQPRDVGTLDAGAVRARFSPARWSAFKRDLAFFGAHIKEWPRPMLDHGYNDPPPRALLLHLLLRWVPASVTSLLVLTSLDYLVMAAALTAVWSAFGAIPAALVFASLGLSFFARFDFIGGSILRWDWLAALLLGIAALARGAGGRAGLFFGYAALARIFPVLFLLPLAVKWLQAGVRRTPDARVARCLAVAAMVMTVVAGAIWLTAPTSLAREYTARIRLHAQLLDDNSVGLASLVAFNGATWSIDADGRVFLSAAAALAHRPPAWLLSAACVLYLAAALPLILKSRPLASLMYAVPLLFCAVSLSGYYYAFLVLLVLLPWERGRVSAVSVLQMALLSLVTAASFVFELIWQDLLPVFNAAGIQLALFFVLWLAFEYARLTATGARVVSVPADGTLSAAVPAR